MATASIVSGALSVIFSLGGVLGMVFAANPTSWIIAPVTAIIGIITGIVAKRNPDEKKRADMGLALSVIGIILSIITCGVILYMFNIWWEV